jgi:hypothetical protein
MWQPGAENKNIARPKLTDPATGNQISRTFLNKSDLKFVVLMQNIVQMRLVFVLNPYRFVHRLCNLKWQNLHG